MSSPDIPTTSAQALPRPDRPRWMSLMAKKSKEKPAYRVRCRPSLYKIFPWRVERRSVLLWVFPFWTDMSGHSCSMMAVGEVTELAAKDLQAKQALETNKEVFLFDRQGRPIEQE